MELTLACMTAVKRILLDIVKKQKYFKSKGLVLWNSQIFGTMKVVAVGENS